MFVEPPKSQKSYGSRLNEQGDMVEPCRRGLTTYLKLEAMKSSSVASPYSLNLTQDRTEQPK